MSAPPYMKWFWADYHQDTRHLSREEHGAYFLLIGEAWNRSGYLPDDDALLARWTLATEADWARLKPVIVAFFKPASRGRWRHKRICEELATYTEVSRKRKEAGKRGGSARRGKDSENMEAFAKQKPTKPEPEPEVRLEGIKPSKSNRRAGAEARADGASALRVIEGGERGAWDAALAQARIDLDHFAVTDPDFATEIAEFVDVATQRLSEMESAA